MIEEERIRKSDLREANWRRWGPYLAERQWGTVREDYSVDGECWESFPHDHARSRAYRWGEDGLLGITDRECRLCFAPALWNEHDPILKERLFGLNGKEGNHGEDVKECYYYLDSTPTHSYMKALYKYPQRAYPYDDLIAQNAKRDRNQREYELEDTGIFSDGRYFDVIVEYAKAGEDDICIRIRVNNRGPEAARLHLLPSIWFRNTWSWGCKNDGCWIKPSARLDAGGYCVAKHATLGTIHFHAEPQAGASAPAWLFTENETNHAKVFGTAAQGTYFRDAFHEYVIHQNADAINPAQRGTKVAAHYRLDVPGGGESIVRLRLHAAGVATGTPFGPDFESVFEARMRDADAFFDAYLHAAMSPAERAVARQAIAGLFWNKQFYHYIVREWLDGDPEQPDPPKARLSGRNAHWDHLFNRDIISMPDKWEYPWYAAWDLAFHMLPMAHVDPQFAKDQLLLFLREWYMHPNGQIPAYEFAFGDANPPVHAWACWRVYKISQKRGHRDHTFLARAFHKLLINFTWWVNRKDPNGKNLFSGGFLGLDNIGVFDRSRPLPTGGYLEQADGTAWMAFYCATMLAMALELASYDASYEDVASKFFEHFVSITDAMNRIGGHGLWDEEDGFYYDQIQFEHTAWPMKIRSLVGIITLLARLPGFTKRMNWFLENRKDLAQHISCMLHQAEDSSERHLRLLAIPSRERLARVLRYVLDEAEFLSPHGIRSMSKYHEKHPFVLHVDGQDHCVEYASGESTSGLFGGNSNWRGPVWFPINYLLIEALERYHHFYGDTFMIECPTGSGIQMNLKQVSIELSARHTRLFLADAKDERPCHGDVKDYAAREDWKGLLLFHEYFDGDTGRGMGASHQTGWTALVVRMLQKVAKARQRNGKPKSAKRK